MDDRPLYADVAVGPGGPQHQTFTWLVPQGMDVQRGSAVVAPWRDAFVLGIVVRLTRSTEVDAPRPIERVIGAGPLLSAEQLEIAEWIAERYLAPLFSAIALFLPPGTVTGPRKDASAVERVIPEPPAGQPQSLGRAERRGARAADRRVAAEQGVASGQSARAAVGRGG